MGNIYLPRTLTLPFAAPNQIPRNFADILPARQIINFFRSPYYHQFVILLLAKGISGALKNKYIITLLASGVAARTIGVWDNSSLKTAAIGAAIGAIYGIYGTATNKNPGPNELNLKDAAIAVGALGIGLSLLYSTSVEVAFQSLAVIGSIITNQ